MIASPGSSPRPARPDDLRQQLERPLRCAEVGEAEADVGRDDADERHPREVVALGDHLRADEHVDLARGEPREQLRRPPRASGSCRGRAARRAPPGMRRRPPARRARSRTPPARGTARRTAGRRLAPSPRSCSSDSVRASHDAPEWTVSDTLQLGHSIVPPHCRQKTAVAKPRRFSSTSTCSRPRQPGLRRPPRSARLSTTSGPASAYSSRMLTIDTRASGRSSTRRVERDERVAARRRVVVALERRRGRPEDHERAFALGRASPRRRARDSAGSPPACTTRRAPRPRR